MQMLDSRGGGAPSGLDGSSSAPPQSRQPQPQNAPTLTDDNDFDDDIPF